MYKNENGLIVPETLAAQLRETEYAENRIDILAKAIVSEMNHLGNGEHYYCYTPDKCVVQGGDDHLEMGFDPINGSCPFYDDILDICVLKVDGLKGPEIVP